MATIGPSALARLAWSAWRAQRIPGWTTWREACALALASYGLPQGATLVEIGSFAGRSALVLAGARRLRGSGRLHCVDPFDASGDPHSAAIYTQTLARLGRPLRDVFEHNVAAADLSRWVIVHQATEAAAAAEWSAPINLLYLDGDQSPAAVAGAHDRWARYLTPGGVLAVHNAAPGSYAPGHDGSYRLVRDVVRPPRYQRIRRAGTITFARAVGLPKGTARSTQR